MQNAARLIIKTTGEALRGFLNLSIKEHDRHLGLVEAALATAKADLVEIEADTDSRVSRARNRPAHNMGSMVGMGGEVSEIVRAKRHVDHLEGSIAAIQHSKQQVGWFVAQLAPDERYELSTADLMALGLTVYSRGGPSRFDIGGLGPYVDCA